MLSVEGLRVAYADRPDRPALAGIDLEVGDNEVLAVLGANGAGKSTLLKTITGGIRPTAGSVVYDSPAEEGSARKSLRLDRMSPSAIVRAGVVQVPERRRIFPGLTVLENLRAGAFTRGRRAAGDVEWAMGVFPGLRAQAYRAAGTLPVGDQQVLALARALVSRPRLVLVDEISAGISPALACQLFDVLRSLSLNGTSLLIVEQFVNLALDLADRVCVVENGRVSVVKAPGNLCLSDIPWQSTQPGGGNGASSSRSKGARG